MLKHFTLLAQKLEWIKPLAYAGGFALFVWVGYLLAFKNSTVSDQYILPSIVGFFWCLLLVALINVFLTGAPVINAEAKFWSRLRTKLLRAFYHTMAFIFAVLTVLVIWFSIKIIGLWNKLG